MNFRNRVFRIKISSIITPQLVEKVADSLDKWTIYKPEFIALIINSLGGSLIQTQNLANIIKKYSQTNKQSLFQISVPIYCFGEDIVIKSALGLLTIGDKAYVNPYAIVGNMGYVQPFFDLRNFASNWFIKQKHVATNDNMKLLNPLCEFAEKDKEWVEQQMKNQEEELIHMIETNRKLDTSKYEDRQKDIYRNGIIAPNLLLKHGIIDGYTSLDNVLQGKKVLNLV
ncbi:unnamed protein product (macronuclear) [Paramecium tetraurelia]|uniref:Peptidase S49 domain-containing protein n=1 Tax=Paramecium tetraurelia TaxID=5888 RepID=A0DLH9_PARTE|nr:uncharacterized protein GSPATT00018213001 [Paramecium tetraurelia]CAK83896.1 unnamed protein product [Paramecium tetraurelia]|eukprot:XP_001451293.1 hypothetical protein (macronuclear) [Paramecium tetraurelia strain d4-2]